MDSQSFMEAMIENPGHWHIVRKISSFLDAKSLSQCRLVCQSWRDLIDNDRPWLLFQLRHLHSQKKTFVDYSAKGKPKLKESIQKRFPEWNAFIQQISRKQSITRLKEIVKQMWIYLGKIYVFNPLHNAIVFVFNPLHIAIVRSNTEFVQLLVDCGIDLTMTDPDTYTPMHCAAELGNLAMMQLLLKHQPDFETTLGDPEGQTIFHLAANNEDPEVLKLILETFRFEEARNENGWSMIHIAVAFGPKETIRFLLEARPKIGLNLEARTNEGDTILHHACRIRDIDIVDAVFKALEEVNSDIDFVVTFLSNL